MMFINRKVFIGVALLAVCALCVPAALAQLNPRKIPQFVDPLPLLSVQGGSIETLTNGTATVTMEEFKANVLPANTVPGYMGTWVWGYRISAPVAAQDTYIGPVFVVPRGTASNITWQNNLPADSASSNLLFWKTSVDQTMHWADPIGPVGDPLVNPYNGPIPAVVHLHGGEVPPQLDGGPDAWYTSDGNYQGHSYYAGPGGGGDKSVYNYPNLQEAAPIWFHDHALGITRLNVYAGLAGGYIITDNTNNPPPGDLKDPTKIIPLVIQDRMFDVNGQLFFPNIGINPEHPFWVPEFVGDTILVNGKTWPYIEVEAAKYRFLFLNGSNARAYQLRFKAQGKGGGKMVLPTFWVISTDGGYLDNPVPLQQLTIMPGERYGVLIDFSAVPAGTSLLLTNSARTPFPNGANVQSSTTGRVMEFRVIDPAQYTMPVPPKLAAGFVWNASTNLRPLNAIERLVNAAGSAVGPGTNVTRQLTLNEVMGPGGPLEVLVNNTKWGGLSQGATIRPDFTAVTNSDGSKTYYSELPQEGETELWEIINMTADAHPIHLHLVQFQLMNRQPFDLKGYTAAYDALFPGGAYLGGWGPPLDYNTGLPLNTAGTPTGILGGNPSVNPFLLGAAVPVGPSYEYGWKDTVIMYPGEVTRIRVRWAPTDLAATIPPTDPTAVFPFNPNGGHGFVWHCHIIDHEDNEMMRPTQVQENPAFIGTRDFIAF